MKSDLRKTSLKQWLSQGAHLEDSGGPVAMETECSYLLQSSS